MIAIDLYCGLGGWSQALIAEGWYCVGFDIERHEYWVPDDSPADDGGKGMKPVAKRGWSQGCAISMGMEGTEAAFSGLGGASRVRSKRKSRSKPAF